MASYVFTTFCGCRPAEPCSLTVAATHQLLTQLLTDLMYSVRFYEGEERKLCGATFRSEEVSGDPPRDRIASHLNPSYLIPSHPIPPSDRRKCARPHPHHGTPPTSMP
jgi:hypothetical protein